MELIENLFFIIEKKMYRCTKKKVEEGFKSIGVSLAGFDSSESLVRNLFCAIVKRLRPEILISKNRGKLVTICSIFIV